MLASLHENNLRLSATKTLICPQYATIIGWVWSKGTIRASSHRLLALECATPPTTVHGLRSFIGAYKVLSPLKPLETIVAGMPSREKINWTDDLLEAFSAAKSAPSQ